MSLQYLEDFLAYTEELPQIFCDRLTKVRELDLEARNREDHTRQLKSSLYLLKRDPHSCSGPARSEAIEKLADEIRAELDRIVELSTEKIRVVASLEEVMWRFNQRLDRETEKFKREIEAESPGCTVRLDARAEEEMCSLLKYVPRRDGVASSYSTRSGRRTFGQDASNRPLPGSDIPALADLLEDDMRLSAHGTLINENWSTDAGTQTGCPVRNHRGRFAPAPMAFTELSRISQVDSSPTDPPVSLYGLTPRTKSKRLIDKPIPRANSDIPLIPSGDSGLALLEEEEDDSRKYCFCEGLGGGLMVACDSADCVQEWFHGDCVGIKSEADIIGKKWYCPNCSETLEKVAAVHRDLGLRPRGPRLNAAASVVRKGKAPAKDRRGR